MIFLKDKAKIAVMNRYFLMFMFGAIFVILEVIQRFIFSNLLFYTLSVLEVVGVYFVIKNLAEKELWG